MTTKASFCPSARIALCLARLVLIALVASRAASARAVDLADLSFAYQSLLDKESFCTFRRAVVFSDKPAYKPGEVAYFSVYSFNLLSKQPLSNCSANAYNSVTIYDVNDKYIASLQSDAQKAHEGAGEPAAEDYSVMFYSYEVPKDLPGGVYAARVAAGGGDEVRFSVMAFSNRKVALVGDWNADFVRPGDLLKGKLTLKVLTAGAGPGAGELTLRWTDGDARELSAETVGSADGVFQVSFKVPAFKTVLIFSAEVASGNYKAAYKREFQAPSFADVVVDFAVANGKLVRDLPNKVYFQAFATAKRDAPAPVSSARVVRTVRAETTVVVPALSSDALGKGLFEISVTSGDVAANAVFALEVKYDADQVIAYPIVDLQQALFSPVLLRLESLYYEARDKLAVGLETLEFTGNVRVVLQDKTQIYENKQVSFGKSKAGAQSRKKSLSIHLAGSELRRGGVLTLQVYAEGPSARDSGKKGAQRQNAKKKVLVEETGLRAGSRRRLSAAPAPAQPPTVSLAGEILQEVEIFVEPASVIGLKAEFDKPHYLAGDRVEFKVSQDRKCARCAAKSLDELQAVVFVTDESAFLEIEKSRESASVFTKVFLEREVLPSAQPLPFSSQYIDHVFDARAALDKDQLTQRRRNVEYLLGNAALRKFLFDPARLDRYLQQPYDDAYQKARNLYEYLLPQTAQSFVQPVMYNLGMPVFRKNIVHNAAAAPNAKMVFAEAAFAPAPPAAEPPAADAPGGLSEDDLLKRDTIYHAFKLMKGKHITGEFRLPDRVTNFAFRVFVFSAAGLYGYFEKSVAVRKPVTVSADLPLFIYKDEEFTIPVLVENNQARPAEVEFARPRKASHTVKPNGSVAEKFAVSKANVPLTVEVTDRAGALLASYRIAPELVNPGVLAIDGTSGFIRTGAGADGLQFASPHNKELIAGNNKLQVCYRNGILSVILDTVREFNRIPTGCFEQASTTTFPIIVALKVLRRLPQTPEIKKLTEELVANLKKGIELLLTYECKTGGFEWFGKDPGHPTLTAYGLWQFYEVAKLDPGLFQPALLKRLEAFLRSQRDLKGGFLARQGLDSLGNPDKLVSDVYILFVLSSQLPDVRAQFGAEFDALMGLYKDFKAGRPTLDSYKLAVLGLLLVNAGNDALAGEVMGVLAGQQDERGAIANAETSITRSSGASLAVETTALTLLLALSLKGDVYKPVADKAIRFLSENLKRVYYQSTPATILSLLAVEHYLAKFAAPQNAAVRFAVTLNGRPFDRIEVSAANALEKDVCLDLSPALPDLEARGEPPKVAVEPATPTSSPGQYFFAIRYEYYSSLPSSAPKSPLEAAVARKDQGDVAVYTIKVQNRAEREQGMAVVEFNRPSCYDFNINDLEGLRQKGDVAYYELRELSRTLVFYFRGLRPLEARTLTLSLVKRFADSSCKERAHSVYLYYDKDGSILYRKA